jgi:acyl-CoA thioester hydrolase
MPRLKRLFARAQLEKEEVNILRGIARHMTGRRQGWRMNWDLPQPYTLELAPSAADIDGLDHTNNAVYVRWCEQAGWAHSAALGLSLADYRRLDRAMAIRRSEYDYLLPTAAGEQLLLGTWLLPPMASSTWNAASSCCAPATAPPCCAGAGSWCIEISSGARAACRPNSATSICRPWWPENTL